MLKDALLAEYDRGMGTTRKLLDRIPDDKPAWKPHEKSMARGELASHRGNIAHWAGTIRNESSFDLSGAPTNRGENASRADMLGLFDAVTKQTRAWMDKSDAEYVVPWSLLAIHRRGQQLRVYLRLNHGPVPSIYGPSADEG